MGMRTGNGSGSERLQERPLGDLIGELVHDGQTLLREEVRIAKAELREQATKASRAGAAFGAGGALLHAALLCLAATLVLIGATFLAAWLSALIVTALFAGAGYALVANGKKRLAETDPARALASAKEEGRWAKETIQSIRSNRHAHA